MPSTPKIHAPHPNFEGLPKCLNYQSRRITEDPTRVTCVRCRPELGEQLPRKTTRPVVPDRGLGILKCTLCGVAYRDHAHIGVCP